jgi:hypothetical protein
VHTQLRGLHTAELGRALKSLHCIISPSAIELGFAKDRLRHHIHRGAYDGELSIDVGTNMLPMVEHKFLCYFVNAVSVDLQLLNAQTRMVGSKLWLHGL